MQTPQGTPTASPSPDEVTFIVFQGNHSSRTFNISLRWLSRLGALAGLLLTLTCVSLIFAVKFKYALRRMDPSQVQRLEQELKDLKSFEQWVEAKKSTAVTIPASVPSPQAVLASPAPLLHPGGVGFVLGTILPPHALPIKNSTPLPITVESLKVQWNGRTLRTRFNIHYSADDKGTQQGTVIVIARGAKTLLGYPAGIFGDAESPSLVIPNQGEHFSVSRFREVIADFGPLSSTDSLKTVEIMIFNEEDQLLFHQTAHPEIKAAMVAPTPPPVSPALEKP